MVPISANTANKSQQLANYNAGSFRDSVSSERVFVAPGISYQINDRTDLTVDGSYLDDRRSFDRGIVAVGTGVADLSVDLQQGELKGLGFGLGLSYVDKRPGDRVFDSFTPLHFGTFGGLPTRILYVFVGLAPTILMMTGFTMWRHRQRSLNRTIRQ